MNCTVDYSVMGRVSDPCGQQEVLGYLVLAICFAAFFLIVAIASQKEKSHGNHRSHPITPVPAKATPQAEDLPALAPVESAVSPVIEPPVVVLELAPVPVADPALGWSKPVYDEAVLSIPAFMRKLGLTGFEVYKFAFEPDWPKFYKLREQEKAAGLGHVTSAVDFFTRRESEPDPVFDPGERLPVGFDGVPVH